MKNYKGALADCLSALSIDPKCKKAGYQIVTQLGLGANERLIFWQQFNNPSKSITQKGNAFLGLGQFDKAKECYEELRTLGDDTAADCYLKKLDDVQERGALFNR